MQDLLGSALELMLLGMGTVLVFLTLLVAATTAMSGFASRYPDEAPKPPNRPPAARPTHAVEPSPPVRKAIEIAIARYRKEH